MDDSANLLLSNLSNFSSAKIKLDELFLQFLTSEGSNNIVALLSKNIKTLTIESDDERETSTSMATDDNKSSNYEGISSIPGVSSANKDATNVTAAAGVKTANNVIIRKSPKKRTQSEMLNNTAVNNTANANANNTSLPNELSRLSLSSEDNSPATTINPALSTKTPVSAVSTPSSSVSTPSPPSASSTTNVPTSATPLHGESIPDSDHNKTRRANFDNIPIFYFPGKKSTHLIHINDEDKLNKRLSEIEAFFKPFPGGIPMEKFVHVTKRLCGIPSFFNLPLCKRINERFGDAESGMMLDYHAISFCFYLLSSFLSFHFFLCISLLSCF
jgi:hypothetical protein